MYNVDIRLENLPYEHIRWIANTKPFRSHHAQQIKLVDEPVLPTRDLDELYSEITQSISPILALLSEKRASAIRQYLKYRLHYLKAAMG